MSPLSKLILTSVMVTLAIAFAGGAYFLFAVNQERMKDQIVAYNPASSSQDIENRWFCVPDPLNRNRIVIDKSNPWKFILTCGVGVWDNLYLFQQ